MVRCYRRLTSSHSNARKSITSSSQKQFNCKENFVKDLTNEIRATWEIVPNPNNTMYDMSLIS